MAEGYPIEITLFLVIIVGLAFGSFATMLSHRLPHSESLWTARSRCPNCRKPLGVRELVPVFSWIFLKGRCRGCGTKVGIRYPLTELATALAFLIIYMKLGLDIASVLLMALAVCLVVMTVIDLEWGIIPDPLQIVMLLLGIGYRYISGIDFLTIGIGFLTGLAIGAALRWGYAWVRKREGLGLGDVKFLAVAGTWLGVIPLVPFLFMAGMFGVVTAIFWRLGGGGKEFPFGPALGSSLFLCLVYPELRNFLELVR